MMCSQLYVTYNVISSDPHSSTCQFKGASEIFYFREQDKSPPVISPPWTKAPLGQKPPDKEKP